MITTNSLMHITAAAYASYRIKSVIKRDSITGPKNNSNDYNIFEKKTSKNFQIILYTCRNPH